LNNNKSIKIENNIMQTKNQKTKDEMTNAEIITSLLLFTPKVKLIESRFRATDRNLTIRLRNHDQPKP